MLVTDTIVAIASGWGQSAHALIRCSGPGLASTLVPALGSALPGPHGIGAVRVRLAPHIELPSLAIYYQAPRSYTGQDCLELLVPGNPLLLERIIAALTAIPGVREATPGEFSARAYLHGKLTLEQAEAVAATIAARTQDDLDAAASIASGISFDRYRDWTEEVATLLALVEAGVDFTDQEDVVPIPPRQLHDRVGTVAAAVRAELGSRAGSELSTARPVVVLAGAPNAGKSTLFNTLLGRRRAVVSSIAGTTRDVLREELDLSVLVPGAPRVILTDPAGLDKTLSLSSVLDEQSQAAARRAIAEADVVVHCDPNGTFPPLPARAGATVIRVRTKSDLVRSPCDRSPIADLDVCALDGWNLGALTGAIADAASGLYDRGRGADTTGAPASRLLPRHRRALAAALVPLDQTARLTHAGSAFASAELIAGSLRAALDALAELTGRVSPDDIVGRIFATFCIGK